MTIDDVALEERLGRVLAAGSAISTALLAAGLAAFFIAPTAPITDWLLSGGLLLLLATPVARVLVATLGYVANRNWLFAALAMMVLTVLIAGAVIAIRGQ